jgi:hypothetical protein
MVVRDLDVFSARGRPTEADTVLVVDADAVLTGAVTLEGLESVARRHTKVVAPPRDLQLSKLASCDGLDDNEPLDSPPMREALGVGVPERHNHDEIVTRRVINVKRDYHADFSGEGFQFFGNESIASFGSRSWKRKASPPGRSPGRSVALILPK